MLTPVLRVAADAVRADYERHGGPASKCQLGDLVIVKPDGAPPTANSLWVMGFNGGETAGAKDLAGDTPSARRWFRICRCAAEAVGSKTWILGERTHWGSPNIPELVKRVGSQHALRRLLRFHSVINRTLLRAYRPKVVWMTGLAYMVEAMDDYGLAPVGAPATRDKRGRLWQEFCDSSGVGWLATIHPTGARMSVTEFERVKGKLRELAVRAQQSHAPNS